MKKLTSIAVISFLENERTYNNSIVNTTLGNGGAGLDESQVSDCLIESVKNAKSITIDIPSADMLSSKFFDASECYAVSFEDGNLTREIMMWDPEYCKITTNQSPVFDPRKDIYRISETYDKYLIDLVGDGSIGVYDKEDWSLDQAIEDQKNMYNQ